MKYPLIVAAVALLSSAPAKALQIPLHLFEEARPRIIRPQIGLESNRSVEKWVRYFGQEDRERFDRFMQRGALYKTLIQDILVENGVPPEMYYLAMIESGFARHATSHVSAVGVWQFMAPTARRFGLRVDKEVDERLDIIRSTRAAAKYLRRMYKEFGSWYLAMAGYNAGEGRVRTAVRRGGTRDFWKLAARGLLPSETIDYVPKFQAAMRIARNPEKYGFQTKTLYEFPNVQRVRVPSRVHLADVARRHRVSVHTVVALNPQLKTGRTPISRAGYDIWLPKKL